MFGCQRLAIVVPGKDAIIVKEIINRHVRRETIFTMNHHELRFRSDRNEVLQLPRFHAFPEVIQQAPARHAVHIAKDFPARQRPELRPRERLHLADKRLRED